VPPFVMYIPVEADASTRMPAVGRVVNRLRRLTTSMTAAGSMSASMTQPTHEDPAVTGTVRVEAPPTKLPFGEDSGRGLFHRHWGGRQHSARGLFDEERPCDVVIIGQTGNVRPLSSRAHLRRLPREENDRIPLAPAHSPGGSVVR
jgi:hypothetical protein